MTRCRWFARSGSVLAVTATIAVVAAGLDTAAAGTAPPGQLGECGAVPRGRGVSGAWWHRTMELDTGGGLSGWQLDLGAPGARTRRTGLPAESAVSGPTGGLVAIAEDDGRRSSLRIADPTAGCAVFVHESAGIIRTAILGPSLEDAYFHLLRRSDRADLGIWRIGIEPGGGPRQVLRPPDARTLARIGRPWSTELRFDAGGARLAVGSCSPVGCVTRVVDLADGSITTVTGDHGSVIALSGRYLAAWASCHGLPCAVVSIDIGTGERHVLHPSALAAEPLGPDGRRLSITSRDGGRAVVDVAASSAGEAPR